ncbi:MAG TPA: hypothetical protein VLI70_05690 [Micrococcaceae bacterium]|nr:hypothetical protein [Micrococcaceae bacterium]
MITVMQWVALGLGVACAAWRLPAAIRGRNASLFWAFLLIAIAVGLSLPAIYLPVDGLLGGRNFANLILRFALYAIFFILASKIAAAYRSPRAERLIRGPIGISVLLVICVGTVVPFLLSDLPVSSTGLAKYLDQAPVGFYIAAGRLYPAYAAACLIVPTAIATRSSHLRLERVAAACICAAFSMVVLMTVVQLAFFHGYGPTPLLTIINLLSYGAIICLTVGLGLVWLSIRSQARKTRNSGLANLAAPTTAQVSRRHAGEIDDTP